MNHFVITSLILSRETTKNDIDDEDDLLYGDTDPTTLFTLPPTSETKPTLPNKGLPW